MRKIRSMTVLGIGLIIAIKGAIVTVLVKKGWWPNWEKRALKREEHKRVLRLYEEWCERTGTRPAAMTNDLIAKSDKKVRPIR